MLSLPPSVRIFLCLEPTDMRRGFDTLAHMAREIFEQDPLSGHLFVFRGRQGQRLKILYWDGDGLAIWYKRLERGSFAFPQGEGALSISAAQLLLILEGIDPARIDRKKRYENPAFCS